MKIHKKLWKKLFAIVAFWFLFFVVVYVRVEGFRHPGGLLDPNRTTISDHEIMLFLAIAWIIAILVTIFVYMILNMILNIIK